jgi:nucleotide-binding universal stress UspA family protein
MPHNDKPLVFPTDLSEASLAAFPWVKRMAETLGAEVHCITVVSQPFVYPAVAEGSIAAPAIAELTTEVEPHLEEFVREKMSDLPKPPVQKVLTGRPADEIVRYAKEVDAAMVVMSTHGHSGVAHLLIGSTAEHVVRQSACPVLTVRCR